MDDKDFLDEQLDDNLEEDILTNPDSDFLESEAEELDNEDNQLDSEFFQDEIGNYSPGGNRFKNSFNSFSNEDSVNNFRNNNRENREKLNNANAAKNVPEVSDSANKASDASSLPGGNGSDAMNALKLASLASDIAENPEEAQEAIKGVVEEKAKQEITAQIFEALAAHPVVLAVIIVVVLLLIILLLFFIVFDYKNMNSSGYNNNYACGSSVDSPISVTHTPLSRSQFIEALENYQSSNSHYADLRDNAGMVYDLGVEYGINPELAVIRAELEGYSPGSNYNYWGIGCYNSSGSDGSCSGQYSSLENGLIAFYNTIKAYNTDNIYEVMSRYAYIGDNWYYPGSSSRGGCYYYPYIREYLSPTRDAQVGTSCEQGTEIATTDEDQLAYTKWQVDNGTMAKRLAIFNLGPDSIPVCESYDVDATPTPTSSEGILTSADGTVETILAQHGSSIAQLNDKIKQNTLQKGIGSRQAVAGAASILINTFDSYGYKLPYSYSGGWGGGYNDNPAVTSYYGVNPAIGTSINNGSGYTVQFDSGPTTYYYVGYDCSGFVAWALRNGGINHSVIGASAYRNDDGDVSHSACSTEYIGQPGDVLANAHHVILILSYNSADQTYTIAEAKGKSYGILSSTVPLSSLCSYDVVDMSSFYENSVNTNYEADFEAGRKG